MKFTKVVRSSEDMKHNIQICKDMSDMLLNIVDMLEHVDEFTSKDKINKLVYNIWNNTTDLYSEIKK